MLSRKEQLEYCKVCQNKTFSQKSGIICKITNAKASFTTVCKDYVLDTKEQNKLQEKIDYNNRIKADFTFGLDHFGITSGITSGLIIIGLGVIYMFFYLLNGYINLYALVFMAVGVINVIHGLINYFRRKNRDNATIKTASSETLD